MDPDQILSGLFGRNYQITSATRSPQHNAAVGGAPGSDHLTGNAVDIVVPGMSPRDIRARMAAAGVPNRILLDEGDHVHWSFPRDSGGQSMSVPSAQDLLANNAPDAAHVPQDTAMPSAADLLGAPVGPPADVAHAPQHSLAGDVWSGLSQPFRDIGHEVANAYREKTAEAQAPLPGPAEALRRTARDVVAPMRIGAQVATAIPSAIQGAVVRPLARAAVASGPQVYQAPQIQMGPGGIGLTKPRALSPDGAQQTIEGALNSAASAVRPAAARLPMAPRVAPVPGAAAVPGANLTQQVRATMPQMPVPMPRVAATIGDTVSRLKDEKAALYAKVDNSGFTFPGSDISNLAQGLTAEVRAKGGPQAAKASPQADSIIGRIKALSGQPGGVTLSQLDQVRSDIWPLLMENGGSDAVYGGILRRGIEKLIEGAQAPYIADARAANMRWQKADDVARRVRSAELAAGRANSGENFGNTVRQKLSPMIDPMHSGQVQNLTGPEAKALETVVVGDKTQNAMRAWSKALRNPFWTGSATTPAALLGFLGGGPVGGAAAAGGVAAGMQAGGQVLKRAAEARTMANVQKLIDLIAQGGAPAIAPRGAPSLTPRGLIGANALLTPLARPPEPSRKKAQRK